MNKREKKLLVGAIFRVTVVCLVIVIAFIAFSSTSTAWFVDNSKVTATDLFVVSNSMPCLVISKTKSDVINCTNPSSYTSKTFTVSASSLEAATHVSSSVSSNLLAYANNENVNPLTGMAKDSDTLTYSPAVKGTHYVECVTYVGASGGDLTFTKLTLKLSKSNSYARCGADEKAVSGTDYFRWDTENKKFVAVTVTEGSDVSSYYAHKFNDVYKTVCVDVYYDGSYIKKISALNLNTESQTITLAKNQTISPSSPKAITLRVYFDGALSDPNDDSGKAILRAGNQRLNTEIYLRFTITATS